MQVFPSRHRFCCFLNGARRRVRFVALCRKPYKQVLVMPLYDYTCKKCDQTFELLVRSSQTPECPKCGSRRLDRHVSMPTAPGKSGAIIAAGRARAAREGHLSNYRRTNGKIVD
jgi:putative FmdB family regulatory protein